MANVGFLGTGIMGAPMARNLMEAGHQLAVYNRTPAKTTPLVKAGARRAGTPAEAAEGAEYIISMVGDDDASRAVWLGPGGALAGAPAVGAIAIECATLSHDWILELEGHARAAGLGFIDGPVTGGPPGAEAGTLTLLVGAEDADLAAARALMLAYGGEILHFGPVGAGISYKLVANLITTTQIAALAEGLVLAARAGLDLDQVGAALAQGAPGSPAVKTNIAPMTAPDHEAMYFSVRWQHKDASCALALARKLGQNMPVSAAARDLYHLALAKGLGEKNTSAVIEALR